MASSRPIFENLRSDDRFYTKSNVLLVKLHTNCTKHSNLHSTIRIKHMEIMFNPEVFVINNIFVVIFN